ncbi:enoyl-CoA hydratase/carnithine racemase [Luteibacter sp. OK325]|uniref:enoyl-CoA hydratase/isomerase family protein n=1 Tax=Luteibacter sp. OK325 TaxID=2135670 RepID=UPI000D3797A7|nr:enoyl-CoA hydratase/isomerase family protein [Luteibacter sp. OK325]PTR35409.1 enoyl-CoA hydratase/carnithine racemase [Luteibacter sp. OK325]
MSDATLPQVDEAPVLFEEHAGENGKRIGIATLNTPKTLNGLSLEMVRLLDERLRAWAADDAVVVVVLQGAGEKAFCAGGDLHSLYKSMRAYQASGSSDVRDNTYASDFFSVEYRLDYLIHTYPKPILCWGHGIVMGGGIGLMAGASHRVVTERSRLAFPEITIGLYPDVGGSYLLHRVPGNAGVFLALTGAPLNGGDAIHAGLADVQLPAESREALDAALLLVSWADDAKANAAMLTEVLARFAVPATAGPLQTHQAPIAFACSHGALDMVVAAIQAMPGDDPWLATARQTLDAGAPGSARLAFALQRRAGLLSLADTFRLEYVVSLHCAGYGDFAEGIRALLIDKDRTPHWRPATLADATPAWVAPFFIEPWHAGEHPLRDLGTDTHRGTQR